MQFHDKKNRQEFKYVSKKSKRYAFLPTIILGLHFPETRKQ